MQTAPAAQENAVTAADLYDQARKAEIEQAQWQRRAKLYTQRGKLDEASRAAQLAAGAQSRAIDLQYRAEAIDGSA